MAQELLMNVQCSGGSKSFVKEMSLEDEDCSGWPLEADNDQLRGSSKPILFSTTWEAAEELNIYHSKVIWHLKQIGKVKKLKGEK